MITRRRVGSAHTERSFFAGRGLEVGRGVRDALLAGSTPVYPTILTVVILSSSLDQHWDDLNPLIMTGGNARERFDSLHRMMEVIEEEEIKGDIVECGVYAGGNSIWLARLFPDRTVWVMDSFEGCQNEADGRHPHKDGDPHGLGLYAYPLEGVRKNFEDKGIDPDDDRIRFVKGFFRDTLCSSSVVLPERIALLRIDCDAHSAYLEVLNGLYDLVEPGGFVIFDDYSMPRIQKCAIPNFFRDNKLKNIVYGADGKKTIQPGARLCKPHDYGAYIRK